jgi:hypothetical protein
MDDPAVTAKQLVDLARKHIEDQQSRKEAPSAKWEAANTRPFRIDHIWQGHCFNKWPLRSALQAARDYRRACWCFSAR